MKKILLLVLVFAFSNVIIAQNLNGYKYALVPSKFSYWKEQDKYRVSTLSKLFMQKYGFEAYLDSEAAPNEFLSNTLNKVYVDLITNNGMFATRIKVVLKDYSGKVLFTSKEGTSKAKDYYAAYSEALREAFSSFETLYHKYDEKMGADLRQSEVKPFKEIVAEPKAIVVESKEVAPVSTGTISIQLYAQPIQNGFQLVDAEPKVVMKLYKTSVKDVYTAIRGNSQGVFVTKNNGWFFEYYQNDKLVSEKVNVKF
jgi:hypothetical protein